jgi:hypothetical protein
VDKKIDIKIGTINFWTEDPSEFKNNKEKILFEVNTQEGNIFIKKDDANKLKISYKVVGMGEINLEYEVSKIDALEGKRHMITFIWDLKNKKLALYIDTEEVLIGRIIF